MERILLIEDDQALGRGIALALAGEGREIRVAATLAQGRAALGEEEYALVLLDLNLPDGNGLDFLTALRRTSGVPVLILTANDLESDQVAGLELGADDYMTKPFNPLELVARVKTQLRRYTTYNSVHVQPAEASYDFSGLYICRDSRKCSLYGRALSLTPLEFDILWYLCEHRGKVVSSEALFEAVWGEKYLDQNNTVMAHIARLREKMGEPSRKPKVIKTVWGVGYTLG